MIKFTGDVEGHPLIGLGLSERNLELLRKGRPIEVKTEDLKLPFRARILIFYGRTEQEILATLGDKVTPDVPIHDFDEHKDQP